MKKQLSENWQLWILMGSVFLALAAGARKIALELEWSEFNANIIFIVSFIAMYIIYIYFMNCLSKYSSRCLKCFSNEWDSNHGQMKSITKT